jgi:4-amino-4-deoxy-L-arabinose transferase-like glycosyltransferase
MVAATVLFAVLALVGGRYGFHRDELYFIEGGRHPDWAQVDNPILVPLLASAWHDLVRSHLWAFRLLPALAAALTVLVASLTSRALGRSRRHQTATAAAVALTSIVPATGHLFSITTFDILLTSTAILVLVTALRRPERIQPWLLLGVVSGLALEVKVLPAVVLLACLLGLLLVGPRAALRRPGPWVAAGIAAVAGAPNLLWQASHGWPMLEISASIAAGGSVSSASRATVVPLHLLMVGPLMAVVLVIGLFALARRPQLRPHRWITVAYVLFLAFVVLSGGKPYYLAGFFPVGLAAGVMPVLDWVERSRPRVAVAAVLVVLFAIPTAFFSLPLAPPGSFVYRVAATVNPDTGETVGWDGYLATVRRTASALTPAEREISIILARNYGEAGALARARRIRATDAETLPPVFSGHNAFAEWGPPPPTASTVIAVGNFSQLQLESWFLDCDIVDFLSSPAGVDNEEDNAPVRICRGVRQPWAVLWPSMTRLA